MSLKIGIVGLPNVGKSTLFNALTRTRKANVANYPFCTIDPNVGIVEVPDPRLIKLAEMVKPKQIIPATCEFVDIAGLVRGASKGEGLGNQFLANIRECAAIAEVVRVFGDSDVIHSYGNVDPKRDIEIIHAELILADLQTVEKRLSKAKSEARSGDKKAAEYFVHLEKLHKALGEGKFACEALATPEDKKYFMDLSLLTAKEVLYIANIHESQIGKISKKELCEKMGLPESSEVVQISAKIEEELGQMEMAEAEVFLQDLGIAESGLSALIHAAYRTLGLQTYFTAGPKEVRAWTFHKGAKAPEGAGVIHSDFEKGFIAAEVIAYDDYVNFGGELGAKEHGKMRVEGKEYVMHDGDVAHFRFAV